VFTGVYGSFELRGSESGRGNYYYYVYSCGNYFFGVVKPCEAHIIRDVLTVSFYETPAAAI
jgi:hypothetical protein